MSSLKNFNLREDFNCYIDNPLFTLSDLYNSNIFITGGSGFIGKWLLESIIYANERINLNAKITVLTRDPRHFKNNFSHLANNICVNLIQGDITNFIFPNQKFDYIIHGATEVDPGLYQRNPLKMFETIVHGTRRVLEFAKKAQASRFLLISSGAVYGTQTCELQSIPESCLTAPVILNPSSTYGESKRMAELLCARYGEEYKIPFSIARCFSFVGPYLPLDKHFAIGNFIKNILDRKPIHILGDGSPYRSYMYAADLAIWLWRILLKGRNGEAYNVGDETPVSIAELAEVMANISSFSLNVICEKTPHENRSGEWYVPSTKKAKIDLGLVYNRPLEESIKKTIAFHRRSME